MPELVRSLPFPSTFLPCATKVVTFFFMPFSCCPFQHREHIRSGVSKSSATDFNPQLSTSWKLSAHVCCFMLCSHNLDFREHCPACVVPLRTYQLIVSSHVFAEILKKVVAWVPFGSVNVKCVSLARPSCKRAECETTRRLSHVYLQRTDFYRIQQTELMVCPEYLKEEESAPTRIRVVTWHSVMPSL